jgi:hypothetical protein
MISLKSDVEINGIRPEVTLAISITHSVMIRRGWDLVVTSVRDGVHMEGSRHYSGCAFDFRTSMLTKEQISTLRNELASALGPDFDVVIEGTHMHVEFDRRGELR